ncbi:MAG: glucosamine-6-phosphate deaminase [Clostridia bacterium]|nr:glucosamine-6-phosphate deaminase [Clostridia bacterium]
MKVIVCETYEEMSRCAADVVADVMKARHDCVLGLATGSTPVGMYDELVRRYEAGELDFSAVRSVNLDEYYPISPDNAQSYRYFMNTNLFDRVNIDKAQTAVPDGSAPDPEAECRAYEEKIAALGQVDIQVLGIGQNGHIGFNEPAEALHPLTHLTALTESTIKANARFFSEDEVIPTSALTMGMGTILRAKKILILANGEAKADAIATLLSGMLTTSCPASFLNLHDDVVVICDRAAMSKVQA